MDGTDSDGGGQVEEPEQALNSDEEEALQMLDMVRRSELSDVLPLLFEHFSLDCPPHASSCLSPLPYSMIICYRWSCF